MEPEVFDMFSWITRMLGLDVLVLDSPYGMLIMTVACFFLMYALVMVFHVFIRAILYFVNMGRYRV